MQNYGTLHVPANTLNFAGGKLELVKAVSCDCALRSGLQHDDDCVRLDILVHYIPIWWVAGSICRYLDTSSCHSRHSQT